MTIIRSERPDQLLTDRGRAQVLLGGEELFKQVKKAPLERMADAELSGRLGFPTS